MSESASSKLSVLMATAARKEKTTWQCAKSAGGRKQMSSTNFKSSYDIYCPGTYRWIPWAPQDGTDLITYTILSTKSIE